MAEASDSQRMVPARVGRAVDRIGALPDDVLHRVLSQLSSREAVHTCLLGQRWRDLWRSVPIINVSFGEFEDSDADDDVEDTFDREETFKKFVNRFLMLRNPVGLDEFRLDYSSSTGDLVSVDQASISAPSLVTLSIEGNLCFGRLPILKNMASLETASVLLSGDMTDFDADAIRQLLAGLYDVRSLDFCYADRKLTMEKNFRWCPTFSNLINLTIFILGVSMRTSMH
uniref:Uncharacterized protein n=1 Tax=Avena sativa TaxID=4498 RepID=A0ACD6AHG9_AVESA